MSQESEPQKSLPQALQIKNDVKEEIAKRNGDPRQKIVERLVQAEIDRRTEILSNGLDRHNQLVGEEKKLRPSHNYVDANNEKVVFWEEKEKKKKDELAGKIEKLNGLIDKCILEPTSDAYEKLSNFLKKK